MIELSEYNEYVKSVLAIYSLSEIGLKKPPHRVVGLRGLDQ